MKKLHALAFALALVACKKELVCPQDQVDCGGRCVSLQTDSQNCGACGTTCGALEACAAGACGCAPGVESCNGTCTDLTRDPANCGACGTACGDATPFCLAGPAASCTDTCADGRTSCGGSCVSLESDRLHCGACDVACAPGETCRNGACGFPELFVACFNTTEVMPVAADLSPAGLSRPVPGGPIALAAMGDSIYSANNYPSAGVSRIPLEARKVVTTTPLTATNQDVQWVTQVGGLLVATNADAGTLVFLDAKGRIVDELALPDQQSYPNPKELAVVGDMAYVALSGSGPTNGQKLARVDVSGVATCKTSGRCGALAGTIDLLALSGTHADGALPFPTNVLAIDGRIFVTLANLGQDCGDFGCFYAKPAGSGKVVVVDPANADAVTVVDLGAGCANPSGLAAQNGTLWVSCGAAFYADVAPGAMVTIDLSQPTLAASEPIALAPVVPGKVAFCGGVGYVGDQATGNVLRFDPATGTFEEPLAVCPTGPFGFTSVSDIECAP